LIGPKCVLTFAGLDTWLKAIDDGVRSERERERERERGRIDDIVELWAMTLWNYVLSMATRTPKKQPSKKIM
jgi:hypothetical protein